MLDTPRLRLRPLRPGDEPRIEVLLADERVIRHMLFPRFDAERAARFVARNAALAPPRESGQLALAVTEPADDVVLGLVGLLVDASSDAGELWYLVDPARWGEGLVPEAARAVVEHAFGALALHRVWASVLPENPASERVLVKLGFRREGHLRRNLRIHGEWRDSYLYAVLAEEWPAAGSTRPG